MKGCRSPAFHDYEQLLFSRVVALAEKAGKKVHLLVVPSSDILMLPCAPPSRSTPPRSSPGARR